MFNPLLFYQKTAVDHKCFETVWDTSIFTADYSDTQIRIYLLSYAFTPINIIWGDGTSSYITTYNSSLLTHTYPSSGIYRVKIYGKVYFSVGPTKHKLIEVKNFGELILRENTFAGAVNVKMDSVLGKPIIEQDLLRSFYGCTNLTNIKGINTWNIAHVTSMSGMFGDCTNIEIDVSSWDVSSVTSVNSMFNNCKKFNSSLANWDVRNIKTFNGFLNGCTIFNQPFTNWRPEQGNDFYNFFRNMPAMSPQNVDTVLIAFANSIPNIQPNVSLPLTTMRRTAASNAAANALRAAPYNWTVGGSIVTV